MPMHIMQHLHMHYGKSQWNNILALYTHMYTHKCFRPEYKKNMYVPVGPVSCLCQELGLVSSERKSMQDPATGYAITTV